MGTLQLRSQQLSALRIPDRCLLRAPHTVPVHKYFQVLSTNVNVHVQFTIYLRWLFVRSRVHFTVTQLNRWTMSDRVHVVK
jgi:hypothetical protein